MGSYRPPIEYFNDKLWRKLSLDISFTTERSSRIWQRNVCADTFFNCLMSRVYGQSTKDTRRFSSQQTQYTLISLFCDRWFEQSTRYLLLTPWISQVPHTIVHSLSRHLSVSDWVRSSIHRSLPLSSNPSCIAMKCRQLSGRSTYRFTYL